MNVDTTEKSCKIQNQADRQLRRLRTNCLRWMNRSKRRHTATRNQWNAQFTAFTKAELTNELAILEMAIRSRSKEVSLFQIRIDLMKNLSHLTSEKAR